jgi:hypothetical protein
MPPRVQSFQYIVADRFIDFRRCPGTVDPHRRTAFVRHPNWSASPHEPVLVYASESFGGNCNRSTRTDLALHGIGARTIIAGECGKRPPSSTARYGAVCGSLISAHCAILFIIFYQIRRLSRRPAPGSLTNLTHGQLSPIVGRLLQIKIAPGAPPNSQFPGSICGKWRYAVADTHSPIIAAQRRC